MKKITGCSFCSVDYLTIPSGVEVGTACFTGSSLKTVVLSSGCSVDLGAFSGCDSLQRVVVNCSFSSVYAYAFLLSCEAEFVYAGHTYNGFSAFRGLGL